MPRPDKTVSGLFLSLLMLAGMSGLPAFSEPILPDEEKLCASIEILTCLNENYSDVNVNTVPLSLEGGFHYPQFGGIFSTVERQRRAAADEETGIKKELTAEIKELISSDRKTAYRLLSGHPSSLNMVVSLDLLAQEVLPKAPGKSPASYVFMLKVAQSTLGLAAHENKPEIYAAAQGFNNCVLVSIIGDQQDPFRESCGSSLTTFVQQYY